MLVDPMRFVRWGREAALLPDLLFPCLPDHNGSSGMPAHPSLLPAPAAQASRQTHLAACPGEKPVGHRRAPLGPKQSSSLCLCLAQRKAVLPQAMLWGSLWTQG